MTRSREDRVLEDFRARPSDRTRLRLLEAAQGWAFSVAFGVLRQREDAEDVAQEVLLELLEAVPTLNDTRHLRRWTYRASLHEAIDQRRRKQRRMKHEQGRANESRSDGPHADHALIEADERLALHASLAQLDDDSQELLVGYFFEGRTLAQLAQGRGCSTTHVWNQIERGKSALARRLERSGYTSVSPLAGSWLEAIPKAPAPPPVAAEVLARAKTMLSAASPATASGIGVALMAMTQAKVAVPVIGVLCFCLGLGATQLFEGRGGGGGGSADPALASSNEGRSGNSVDDSALRTELDTLRAENERLAARLHKVDELPSSESVDGRGAESGSKEASVESASASTLQRRLERLSVWMTGMRRRALDLDGTNDPEAFSAFQAEAIEELERETAGLRSLMLEDPGTLFAFLKREDVADDFIAMTLNVLIEKIRRPGGSWSIESDTKLPTEMVDGILDLAEESGGRLAKECLSVFMTVRSLEDRQLERLREWIDSPDPGLAGEALDVYTSNARQRPELYDDALRERVHDILRHGRPEERFLVQAALGALIESDDPELMDTVLGLLQSGRYPSLDTNLIYTLMNRASRGDTIRSADLVRPLLSAARRAHEGGSTNVVVSGVLRLLREDDARTVLEELRSRSTGDERARIDDLLDRLGRDGVTPAGLEQEFLRGSDSQGEGR
ncbi:MAG: sigma-70 family RNA polymerase sigma factor [Planctomycetes bacterium]|nr:sigma-70 family RNA polymerase sigma factor [Planctomycetota bacterium]